MKTVRLVYWRDGDFWIGISTNTRLLDTGKSLEELKENVLDIYADISRAVPDARKAQVLELTV